jgi:BNR/Asp-box repeat
MWDLANPRMDGRCAVMLGAVRWKRRVLPLAVLAILVAINAALIAILLQSQSQVTAEPAGQLTIGSASPTQPASTSPAQGESPSVSPVPSPSPTPPTDQKVAVPTRLLIATSATSAWRATVGDCKTQGQVERSTNGGKSWKQALKATQGPIVQLGLESNGNVYTVGGPGGDCSMRYISYSKNGVIAGQTDKPLGIWSRDPKDPDQIQGPTSASATPCKGQHVVGLASPSTSAALLVCTGGSVMVTSNFGKSWKEADKLVGTMALGAGGGRYWVAGAGEDCVGVSVRSFTFTKGDFSRGQTSCAAGLPVTPELIAISGSGKAIWLWDGNEVHVSTDRGKTWQARYAPVDETYRV